MNVAIVQARLGSTRFPNKVMRQFDGVPLIELLLMRLSRSQRIDRIVLATSNSEENRPLSDHVRSLGFEVFEGSESDVLDRFYQAALAAKAETVIRITGDCPLIDPQVVDQVIDRFHASEADYASNNDPPTFPDGLDVEVFRFSLLERAHIDASSSAEREHVTVFMRQHPSLTKVNLAHTKDLSSERWTVDEPEDFEVVQHIVEHFAPNRDFGWQDVLELRETHPEYFEANQHLIRNEGAVVSTGAKLWKRAKRVIPGGSMLLSKRAEMFLPDGWPAYFSRARGCRVWDLDGSEYDDVSLMGIGTNLLGYGHPDVDAAVLQTVDKGNMSTLNCPEEVFLAERLVELHPWSEMVRFARSGGEANAIAIRIARAASGREKVAICGYHGWHDWYLAANLGDDQNLAGHLLPGLQPDGVPAGLRGTVLPFRYNRFEELENLVRENPDIGIIKMEVARSEAPEPGFLQKVRQLASAQKIVLIFDECTSGFRETFGGLHKKYGVEPDMAVFGKTLGNGYAITAVIGRREVMESAQSTFLSSTFWTERIGPTAALASLKTMERLESWRIVTEIGERIVEGWRAMAIRHDLPLTISGLPSLAGFRIDSPDFLAYKTLITQEMLKRGFLASTSVYACIEHSQDVLSRYFDALDEVFAMIARCEDGQSVTSLLEGPVCHSGFQRLN
jgi:glutamate-1-semialdehyde 2,1-aminomutase